MSEFYYYHEYIPVDGAELYTAVALPEKGGKFPTVIFRSPYLDFFKDMPDGAVAERLIHDQARWLREGYAVVLQHCRGRGKSTGDCIPYIYERADGLALHEWVRGQEHYNGELILCGDSYTAAVHFLVAPFAPDIKGAILMVMDTERYNANYRNGQYKIALNGNWYIGQYKAKSILNKNWKDENFLTLPFTNLCQIVFGEEVDVLQDIFRNPSYDSPYWQTTDGGSETRGVMNDVKIPVLLITGLYDIFTGGICDMWRAMPKAAKDICSLVIHPYDHGHTVENQIVDCPDGSMWERWPDIDIRWADFARGEGDCPVERGKVSYYSLFGKGWCTDDFERPENSLTLPIGEGEHTYTYDPADPTPFKGGLSANFGGVTWQDAPGLRQDILTFYTPKFERDTTVLGNMEARLRVKSDAEDTAFYVRLSLEMDEGDYGLRDDITAISNFVPDYVPGDTVELSFRFDDHAFTVKAGQRIRVDVASAAFPLYVPHTNVRGLYSQVTERRVAHNTVIADGSHIKLFIK